MTEREAEIEMFNLLTEENGAMIPVGHVNQLIHKIYKEFEKEKQIFQEKTKKKAYEGYLLMSKCAEQGLEELKYERELKDYLINNLIKDLKEENKKLKDKLNEYS